MQSRRAFLSTGAALLGAAALPGGASASNVAFPPIYVRVTDRMPAGQIHVLPDEYMLLWTLGGGRALRYSVGVARPGLYEHGTFTVARKAEWPRWTPTPDMIEREPHIYAQYADGMPGGPTNPLGARALYLYEGQRDTYLRIHGTHQDHTIGTAVSNGCARLTNTHVVDLYNRVPLGTPVRLHPRRNMA